MDSITIRIQLQMDSITITIQLQLRFRLENGFNYKMVQLICVAGKITCTVLSILYFSLVKILIVAGCYMYISYLYFS